MNFYADETYGERLADVYEAPARGDALARALGQLAAKPFYVAKPEAHFDLRKDHL